MADIYVVYDKSKKNGPLAVQKNEKKLLSRQTPDKNHTTLWDPIKQEKNSVPCFKVFKNYLKILAVFFQVELEKKS